jgi:hypothetical protein
MTPNYRRETEETTVYGPPSQPPQQDSLGGPHQVAVRGLAQKLSIDPRIAFATVAVDFGLHSADVVTAGLLLPFSIAAGIALTVIASRSQMKWSGDDYETACLKGFIIGLLTAIPSPLPYVLFVPAGILGWFHNRRK